MIHALIAEFNPLHKGHESLIRLTKSHSSGVVVLLSSAFTQRGSPGLLSKFARAQMAIESGADLVLELPFMLACNAASEFARGAVNLAASSGVIDSLAFGMEDPDFDVESLIRVIETEEYRVLLRRELASGASFSKASALALEKIFPGSREFTEKPNNLLGLLYVMNIRKHKYNMKTLAVKREGYYRSKNIREDMTHSLDMMPESSRRILLESKLSQESKLWPLLQNIFLRSSPEDLHKIYGIDEGIENLFLKHWRNSKSLDDFIGRCVCARYTRSHIRRRLVYILLNIDRWEVHGMLRGSVPYAKVLGFNFRGREILHECRRNLHVITSLSGAKTHREKFFAQVEYRASQLWELLTNCPDMSCESHKVLQFS